MARMVIGMALALVLGQGAAWAQDGPKAKVAPDGTVELELQVAPPKDLPKTEGKVKVQFQVVPPSDGPPQFPPMADKDLQQLLQRLHQQRDAKNQGSNKEVIELLKQIIRKLEGEDKSPGAFEIRLGGLRLVTGKDTPETARAQAEVAEAEKRLAEARAKLAKLQAGGARGIIAVVPETGRTPGGIAPQDLEQRLNRLSQEIEELRRALRKNER